MSMTTIRGTLRLDHFWSARMKVRSEIPREDFIAAVTYVKGIVVQPASPPLVAQLDRLIDDLHSGRAGMSDERKRAIRKLLKNGRYRASGRGKPAQEYLAKIFSEQNSIDLINNAVDVNNIVSLRCGLPISAFDADLLQGGVVIRLGLEDEGYVFNASGQELRLRDLIVACDDRGPIGSPVKDSQATKLFPGATSALYIVYSSRVTTDEDELLAVARELGELLVEDCPAGEVVDFSLVEGVSGLAHDWGLSQFTRASSDLRPLGA